MKKFHFFVKRLAILLALILCFSMIACAGGGDQESPSSDTGTVGEAADPEKEGEEESESPKRDDVVYCITSDIRSLDYTATTDQITNILYRQIYDVLVQKDNDGNYIPALAKSWESSDDGLTWTYFLRDDVVMHDGSKMTAEDVAWSLNYTINAGTGVSSNMVNMVSVDVVDEYTVKVNLSAPYAAHLEVMQGNGRISKKDATDFENNPIGTGPYKFVSRSSGDNIILEGWDQYYRGAPAIKNLKFKIITDSTTQISALQSGEVDFLTHAPLAAKDTVEADENLIWQETTFRGNIWIYMSMTKAPFDNILARKAVQYGVDMNAMLIGGSEGRGKILKSFFPANVPGSPEKDYVPPYSYDLAKAQDYLAQYKAEAGVDEVSIEIWAPSTTMYLYPAKTLEGLLREVGFDVTLIELDRQTFWASLSSGEFTIIVAGTSWPVQDGDGLYMYYESNTAIAKGMGLNDPEVDRLLNFARASSDPEARVQAYTDFQKIMDENAYVVTLYQPNCAVTYNKDLKGVTDNDIYQFYVFDWSW